MMVMLRSSYLPPPLLLLLVLLGGAVLTAAAGADPRVTLEQGVLRGKSLRARSGRTFAAFQGIPYAAPPVGKLRFKPPQPAPQWSGERKAQREGSDCPQTHYVQHRFVGAEDCLFLNVYTPKVESASLPVMVWIHGGAFFAGSGGTELYGPELLLDHDVVLVTINYRLGALGFLSLGTPELPGNLGLKDQTAALRWVRDNIKQFGGNPDTVTIFGESAGGASVTYHLLSPLSRGLFHRAIAQSGSALNPWAFKSHTPVLGREMVGQLGCELETPEEMMRCLRDVPLLKIHEINKDREANFDMTMTLSPTVEPADVEGAFLTAEPLELLVRGEVADVPLMTGLTTHEGMLWLLYLGNRSIAEDYVVKRPQLVPSKALGLEPGSTEWEKTWQRIETFYTDVVGREDLMEKYLLVTSDVDFVLGVDEVARNFATLKSSPVYYYQFAYDGGLGLMKQLGKITRPGTAHADELPYLFTAGILPNWKRASKEDQEAIDSMTKLWTNFAATGNPTPDESLGVRWEPVAAKKGLPSRASTRFLNIEDGLQMVLSDLNEERVSFWRDLLEVRTPHTDTPRQEL